MRIICYENIFFLRVYVYGGYELHSGILNDFIFIDFSLNQLNNWMPVESINPHDSPGKILELNAFMYNIHFELSYINYLTCNNSVFFKYLILINI